MLVAAEDVFLLFDAGKMTPPPGGVTALSIRVEAAMGEGHGVFRVGGNAKHETRNAKRGDEEFPLVVGTMQKASVAEMRAAGVTDSRGRVLIDSGLVFFDSGSTTALYRLAQSIRRRGM